MERPKSPENKDAAYFRGELKKLVNEAEKSDQKALAVVLHSLLGAMAGGGLRELAEKCYEFSTEQVEKLKRKPEDTN
ncbi:MAG: hypothetical protein AAB386_03650 [Patescibacteria group bacterium]